MFKEFGAERVEPSQDRDAGMVQSQNADDPNKIQLKTIRTSEDFEAVADGVAGLGYDPGKRQNSADTAGRRLGMQKLFTECSRPEEHKSIRVLMRGNEVLGSAVVKTEPGEREAEITDIRLGSDTGQQSVIEDFLRELKANLRGGDPPYVRAKIKMPEGDPIRSFIDATEHHWVKDFYIFEPIEDPSKKPAAKDNALDAQRQGT